MKYALISDAHSNLPALEAVLADIDGREDVGAVYHLGDLVGYAPWPDEVVALLRERHIPGIAGNYAFDGRNRLQALRLQGRQPAGRGTLAPELRVDQGARLGRDQAGLGGAAVPDGLTADGGHKLRTQIILVHGTPYAQHPLLDGR